MLWIPALLKTEGGQKFDLVLLGVSTAELVDLVQIEMLRPALPDTPIAVVAEIDNPHRARLILNAGTRGFPARFAQPQSAVGRARSGGRSPPAANVTCSA